MTITAYSIGETLASHPAGHRLVAYRQDGQWYSALYYRGSFVHPHPQGGWGVPDFHGYFNGQLTADQIAELAAIAPTADMPKLLPQQEGLLAAPNPNGKRRAGGAESRERRDRTVTNEPGEECRTVTLTPASSIKVRPVRWLWQGRIPLGALTLIGGREGIGKSTLCYQIAADLTRGRLPGVHQGQPKAVIVAATEDSWEHTIVPRLMAADAALDLVYRVDVFMPGGFRGSLSLPGDLADLKTRIDEVDAAVVLLDPLMSRLSSKLDTHKDAEVRQALEPLVALADRSQIALLGLIHVNKSTTTDPLTMLMASRAFAAVARAVLFATVDPDDQNTRVLGQPKNNLGRTDLPTLTFSIDGALVADTDEGPVWTARLTWRGETDRTLDEVLRASGETSEARTATNEAASWLSDYLKAHPVAPSKDIKAAARKDAGIGVDALKRARQKIGAGATSAGFPRYTYWSAPGLKPDQVDHILADLQSEQSSRSVPGESPNTALTAPTDSQSVQSERSVQLFGSPEKRSDRDGPPPQAPPATSTPQHPVIGLMSRSVDASPGQVCRGREGTWDGWLMHCEAADGTNKRLEKITDPDLIAECERLEDAGQRDALDSTSDGCART